MPERIPLTFRAESGAVLLRAPSLEDAQTLWDVQSESWGFLAPWMPALDVPPDPVGAMRDRLRLDRDQWSEDRAYRFVLCERRSEATMGRVSLNNVVRGVGQFADLGYWIAAPFIRRGFMTAAVRLALDIAFGPLGLHRVQAGIIPRNAASLAVARKIGFREEGFAVRFVKIAGKWEDHVIFALTAEEWPIVR